MFSQLVLKNPLRISNLYQKGKGNETSTVAVDDESVEVEESAAFTGLKDQVMNTLGVNQMKKVHLFH